jgi:hypothetical protein
LRAGTGLVSIESDHLISGVQSTEMSAQHGDGAYGCDRAKFFGNGARVDCYTQILLLDLIGRQSFNRPEG